MRMTLGIAACILVLGEQAIADRALLVGADTYPNLPERFALPGVQKDIHTMHRLLLEVYDFEEDEIMILSGEQATRGGILDAFQNWLVEGVLPGERAIFYYSGHGAQTTDLDGDEVDGLDQAIAPADATFDASETGSPTGFKNLIIDDEIRELLSQLSERRVLAIFDSCFSGTVSRSTSSGKASGRAKSLHRALGVGVPVSVSSRSGSSLLMPMQEWVPRSPSNSTDAVVIVLSASDRNQLAFEDVAGGVFTQSFAQAVREGVQADGDIEFRSVLKVVSEHSDRYCAGSSECATRNGGRLTPQIADPEHLRFSAKSLSRTTPGSASELLFDLAETTMKDPFSVELVVVDREDFRLDEGEIVRLQVRSEQPGRLLVLDFSPDGNAYVIHPTMEDARATRLLADQPTVLDRDLHLRTPGNGRLVALVVEDEINLMSQMAVNADSSIDTGELRRLVLPQLASNWEELVEGEAAEHGLTWGFAAVDYTVAPW